jgi:hypothetical protein
VNNIALFLAHASLFRADFDSPSTLFAADLTVTDVLHAQEAPASSFGAVLNVTDVRGFQDSVPTVFDVQLSLASRQSYIERPNSMIEMSLSIAEEFFVFFRTRVSPPTLLTGSDTEFSRISWSSTDVFGADVVVEVSYNGSTWYQASNGGPLPNLPGSVAGVTLHVRQVFRSVDGDLWASLDSLHVEVGTPLRIESGNISYSYSKPGPGEVSQSSVKRVGTLVVADPVPSYVDPGVAIFKPYVEMQAPSTGNWVRFYLGEFESLAPPKTDDGTRVTLDLRLASREQKLSRASTTDYAVAPVNRNIVLFVREDVLVSEFGETDFNFPATFDTIPDDIVFPPGTKWIEVVNKALESVGWSNLVVNSAGQWTAAPASVTKTPEWAYPTQTPVVRASSVEPFTGDIPNVVVARARRGPSLPVEGNGQITLKNLATGPFSIAGRGGLEVTEEIQVEASDQAALERIGIARAESMFRGGGDRLQLTVGLNPLHDEQDSVLVTKDRFDITSQRFWVVAWSINLGRIDTMATMELTLERHVVAAGTDALSASAGPATSTATATADVVQATHAEPASDTYFCGATSAAQGLVFKP